MTNQPYVEEARHRLEEFKAGKPNPDGKHSDDSIVQLMADYAAKSWQEGYDEGESEGWDRGYISGQASD